MLLKDFVYAERALRRSPVFTITAVITLALGIGASTAIFSVTNGVLLRPLPYKDPDRLVLAEEDLTKRNVKDSQFSAADYLDLRNGTRNTFEDFAAVNTGRGILPRKDGSPEQVHFAQVTPNFFKMMGGRIAIGRDFTDADGLPQPPAPQAGTGANTPAPALLPTIAILSHEYFERRYGGDPSIIGHPIQAAGGGGPVIVGVLAPGFELLFPPSMNVDAAPDVWIAARLAYDNSQRLSFFLRPIGRLKKGVTLERGQEAAGRVAAEIRNISLIEGTAGLQIRLEPMHKYVVAQARPAILALTGAAIFLLLIACANVANLMLVRVSLRGRDLAVRTALGGSWWRLVRHMLAEALLLAGIGTLFGVLLAWLGVHELLVIAPASLPRLEWIRIDPVVLAFGVIAGLAAAVLFGVVPALRAARPDVMHVLRGSSRTAGLSGGGLLRNTVVIAEVALCFVLLIGSGLMFRSFLALQHVDPGFDPHNLLVFELFGPPITAPPQRAAFMRDVHDRLSALPGVESVTASSPFPLDGGFSPIRWGLAPALADPSKFQATEFQIVLPGYFETLRTRLIAGRTFTQADDAPERNLVVIDQMLASKAFPNESAVGKRILIRIRTPQPEWVEVIGVVAHQRDTSLAEPGREQIYFTDGFLQHGAARFWGIRTASTPAKYAEEIRREIAKINSHLLITGMAPMDLLVERAQASTRFSLLLIGLFAVIAAFLAGVGLYGVLSTVVRQRTPEIGVRMALGAAPVNIFKLVIGNGLGLSAAGLVAGMVAAFILTRLIVSMLVGVKATDPLTFAAMTVLFFVIGAIASWLPARRASGLDPTMALRDE
jgi:putative ABC transport system permease protein